MRRLPNPFPALLSRTLPRPPLWAVLAILAAWDFLAWTVIR